MTTKSLSSSSAGEVKEWTIAKRIFYPLFTLLILGGLMLLESFDQLRSVKNSWYNVDAEQRTSQTTLSEHASSVTNSPTTTIILNCSSLYSSPIPIIFISYGQSGSTEILHILCAISNQPSQFCAMEYPGRTPKDTLELFNNLKDEEKNGQWLINKLCQKQEETKNTLGVAALKWKPHQSHFFHSEAIAALKRIKKDGVKVIVSERHILDYKVSNMKHSGQGSRGFSAHCKLNDTACIDEHMRRTIHLNPSLILQSLENLSNFSNAIHQTLKGMNIHYFNTSMEKALIKMDMNEWNNMLRYLGLNRTVNRKDLEASLRYAHTTPKHRNQTISNYDEIAEKLKGSKFEYLLDESNTN